MSCRTTSKTTRHFPACLAVIAAFASGCEDAKQWAKDLLGVQAEDRLDIDGPRPDFLPDVGGAAASDEPDALPRQPLEKALAKYPFLAKGAPNLGFKLTSLDKLQGLVFEPEIPEWGAPSSDDPAVVLDGDLETSWSCVPEDRIHCAIGLHLTRPGKIKAVQIFAAGGTTAAANNRHPRPKKIRLHTAEGFAEANVPDSDDFVYVVLGKEVDTPNLVIEFVEFWKGTTDELRVGEIEILGIDGEPRPPLTIDPDRTFVTWKDSAWRKKGAEFRPAISFIHTVDAEGNVTTLAQGSALRGKAGDRIMLVEQLDDSTCTRAEGTLDLLDCQTRVIAPLGELGGVAGDLFRQNGGLGVALGYTDEFSTSLAGVVVDPDRGYVVKRTPAREDKRKTDTFGNWGFEPLIIPRTGTPLGASTPGCTKATPEQLTQLGEALSAAGKKGDAPSGEQWSVCTAGDAMVFLSDGGTCGDGWQMYGLGANGALVGTAAQKHRGSHIRLRRLSGEELLIEATGKDDTGLVARFTPAGLNILAERGALALPPPGACRSDCGDGFPNPNAPNW